MRPAVGEIRSKMLKLCPQTANFYALMRPIYIKISSIYFFAPVICLVQLNSPAVVSPRINSSTAATLCRCYWAQLFGSLWCSRTTTGRNQLSSSVYANNTLRHASGIQHIWLKTASTVIENLNTLNEHHLLIFCKRVTIIASG